MDRNGPTYIVLFAAAVCLVCSAFVSTAAVSLKERQEVNKKLDQQLKVLNVTGIIKEGEKADRATIVAKYEKHITPKVIDLETGKLVPDADPTTVDVKKALGDPALSVAMDSPEAKAAQVPRKPKQGLIYEVDLDGDKAMDLLVLPIFGKGLWSTLWGFLALEKDGNTIKGITYYEHGETPGLGGEVDNPMWKAKWVGRKVYDGSKVAIGVKKGAAGTVAADPYHVDGLSGATLTSNGVTNMLKLWFGEAGYGPFLKKLRGGAS